MAFSGNQILDPNSLEYGLPTDTCCVGEDDPSVARALNVSKSVGKSPVQTGGKIPVGYDGPLGNTGDQGNG
jgi:hypothetical protein